LKKKFKLSSAAKTLSYGVKIAKIAHGLRFAYNSKFVAMRNREKLDLIKKIYTNIFHLVKRS